MENLPLKNLKVCSLIMATVCFIISLIVFINNYQYFDTEKNWKAYFSGFGFLVFSSFLLLSITHCIISFIISHNKKNNK
jgi:TRAP-type C4-dicarboxylate transport system permease small subunit